jgi:thiamine biosynthesis lipoprotein
MRARASLWVSGLVLAVASLGAGPAPDLTRYEFAETHMGSTFKVVLYSADAATARQASRAAFARIAALDQALSDYNPDSELMRLCGKAGGPPVPVSADLFTVLARAQRMSERSGGAFDVTVAPVVRLWRRAGRDKKMPDRERLAQARSLVDYRLVRLDAKARTVQLLKPGMKLDLGGIAKGYASGEAIAVLKTHGIDRALVAGAGDIVVSGPPVGKKGWTIGIAPLDPASKTAGPLLVLTNAAISTAGDTERFVEIGGKRYSHIVDPRTGLGVVDRCTVTVIANDGATADSLDTAAYVLGPERGLELIESEEGAAAFIIRATPSGVKTFQSRRFKDIPQSPATDRPDSRSVSEGKSAPGGGMFVQGS